MHTLVAYFKAEGAAATLDTITNVFDQSVPQDGAGNFLFQRNWKVLAAAVLSSVGTQARLFSPFLQGMFLPDIYPLIVSATVPDNAKVMDFRNGGPPIVTNDPIGLQASVSALGDVFGLLWVGDDASPIKPGPIMRARFTAAPTLVKGQWVNAALAASSVLPVGNYRVVGIQVIGTAVLAARLVLTGDNRYRPGVLAQPTLGFQVARDLFSWGQFGDFGSFANTNPPSMDFLGLVAGAQTPIVWLDLVKQ